MHLPLQRDKQDIKSYSRRYSEIVQFRRKGNGCFLVSHHKKRPSGFPIPKSLSLLLRQLGRTHQVAVALPRCFPAFVDCPYDQALATSHVTGGKYAFHIGLVVAIFRLHG